MEKFRVTLTVFRVTLSMRHLFYLTQLKAFRLMFRTALWLLGFFFLSYLATCLNYAVWKRSVPSITFELVAFSSEVLLTEPTLTPLLTFSVMVNQGTRGTTGVPQVFSNSSLLPTASPTHFCPSASFPTLLPSPVRDMLVFFPSPRHWSVHLLLLFLPLLHV